MYEKKEKSYGIIAILYYLFYFLGYWVCGIMYKKILVLTQYIFYLSYYCFGSYYCISQGLEFQNVFLQTLYYLFYIGTIEEIVFRGIIQNYLFGFKINKYLTFILGGLLFSALHIPFQMYVHNNISFSYILVAIPNLIETFIFHFIYCFITYKRKNILIPIAFHYTYNILGLIV